MPELTDEHIEDLFADLRAGEIAQVRPPGVAAARTTVRRRRVVTSVAAGVAALAVAGVAAHLGPPAPRSDALNSHRALAPEELELRTALARDVVTRHAPTNATLDSGVLTGGTRNMAVEVVAATYRLRVACLGTGHMSVTVTPPAGDKASSASADVPCDGVGQVVALPFTVTAAAGTGSTGPAGAAVTINSDFAGPQTVYAYMITMTSVEQNRLADVAWRIVSDWDDASRARSGASGPVQATVTRNVESAPTAGKYQVGFACAGTGAVQIRLAVEGEDGKERTLLDDWTTCEARPRHVAIQPVTLADAADLIVEVRTDGSAAWLSGYAYAVWKA
jgi:hypothetical protein